MANTQYVTGRSGAVASTNSVLRNTYMLLSITLLFSAAMAGVSIAVNAPHIGIIPWLIVAFGLLFVINKMRNSAWSILLVFALTGFMGFSLGPVISYYMAASGPELIMTALGMTGVIFFALSGYVLTTKKDFSFMGGFLFTGLMVILGSLLLVWFGPMLGFVIPGLSLAISAAIVLLMSGFILFDTSRIVNGGETNYVMATVSLYLSIYNLFASLLHLLGIMDD